jgi:hypothetical protein
VHPDDLPFKVQIADAQRQLFTNPRPNVAVKAQIVASGSDAAKMMRPVSSAVKQRCSFFTPLRGRVSPDSEKLPKA